MTQIATASLCVLVAYLVGAIPFAFLAVYLAKGIDVRTVGSGNAGATNAARVLGGWTFFPIFLADLLKGLLPTLLLPGLAARVAGPMPPGLAVVVALGAILGHNYPAYLRFRGGKGVATSLGALAALDPAASGATLASAVVLFLVTKVVSITSALAATVFVAVHFAGEPAPFSRKALALDLLTIVLWGMLMVRHRKNFARLAAGTEPRVSFRRRTGGGPPSGRASIAVVAGAVAVAAVAAIVLARASRVRTLDAGGVSMRPVARAQTGHQRAERLAFGGGGRRLAVTCPRYSRLVVYAIGDDRSMTVVRDLDVGGRAVAVRAAGDRFVYLVRPFGDARHVEPGWLAEVDLDGRPVGGRFPVGTDPDDLAISPDGRHAHVLVSGRAEGEANRPAPELISVAIDDPSARRVVGRLAFDRPGDDPARIELSNSGRAAAVSLLGSDQVAAVDLGDPSRPSIAARVPINEAGISRPSMGAGDGILMPGRPDRETVFVGPDEAGGVRPGGFLVSSLPGDSSLELTNADRLQNLGRLPIRGQANLGATRPAGLAYSPERSLMAVANRSGGSVHLVEVRLSRRAIAAAIPGPSRGARR